MRTATVAIATLGLALASCEDQIVSRNQAEDIAADYSYDDSELRSRIEALEQELGDVRDLALENAQNAESARETYNRNAEILNSHIAEYRSHIH